MFDVADIRCVDDPAADVDVDLHVGRHCGCDRGVADRRADEPIRVAARRQAELRQLVRGRAFGRVGAIDARGAAGRADTSRAVPPTARTRRREDAMHGAARGPGCR